MSLDDRLDAFEARVGIDTRTIVWGFLFIALCSSGLYLYLRLQAVYRLETQLALMTQTVKAQQAELADCKEMATKQINELSATIYGPLSEPSRKPSIGERWMRNRDRELRERIRQLELWRYRMDQR